MKKMLIAAMFFVCSIAHAQTWNEWFNQKQTHQKYLVQQIAALKIYLDYAEKGYNIAGKGLQTIHSIKKGDLNLHNDFFNSLKQINPAIKNQSGVADIIAIQIKIVMQTKNVLSSIKQQHQFTPEEIDYCQSVFDKLLHDCLKDIDELISVTTSGELQMKDDERMKQIENIFIDMQDKYAFCFSFSDEMKTFSVQRMSEQKEIDLSRLLNK